MEAGLNLSEGWRLGGGGVYEKLSLQILDLQRLASLVSTVKCHEEEPRI